MESDNVSQTSCGFDNFHPKRTTRMHINESGPEDMPSNIHRRIKQR
jgi:hypothetical protein